LSTLAKVLSFFVLILAVVLAVSSATLFTQQQNYKQKYETVEKVVNAARQEATEATRKRDELQTQLTNAENARDRTKKELEAEIANIVATSKQKDEKIADQEAKLAEANAALLRVPETIKVYVERTDKLESVILEMNETIEAIQKDKREAQKAQKELGRQNAQLTAQVKRLQLYVGEMEDRVARLTGGQPAAPSAAVAQGQVKTPDGTVLAVAGDTANISIGASDGVAEGYAYDVFRGGAYVGQLRVLSVKDNSAVARIVEGVGRIKEEDDVSNRYK